MDKMQNRNAVNGKVRCYFSEKTRGIIDEAEQTDENTQMAEKLKPCPFCGSNDIELRKGFMFNGAIHCNNCTADVVFDAVGLVATGNDNWQKACADGWNKRVGEAEE